MRRSRACCVYAKQHIRADGTVGTILPESDVLRKRSKGTGGSGSHENGCPFKVVAMEKEVQTSIMHEQGLRERERFSNKTS